MRLNSLQPLLSILTTLALSFTPTAAPPPLPTLRISNFGAFRSVNPSIPSHITFNIVDPRPDYFMSVDCVFATNETYPSIFLDGWWHCDSEQDIAFWMEEDFFKLRRPWLSDPKDP